VKTGKLRAMAKGSSRSRKVQHQEQPARTENGSGAANEGPFTGPAVEQAGRSRPADGRRHRPLLIALALLAVALIAGVVASRYRSRPAATAAAPLWERPESSEEARLLSAALARPADGAAQAALGDHYLALRRSFEAAWAYQRARDAAGTATQSEPALFVATALEAAGVPTRALDVVTEAAARNPANAALVERRAELQLHLGRPKAAIASLRSLPSLAPDSRLLLARALEAAGDDAGALAQCHCCAADETASAEASLRLGRLLMRLGRAGEARAALETAHRLAPTRPEPLMALGMSFMPEARLYPERAGRWFNEALRVSPELPAARVGVGRVYALHRRWSEAASQFVLAVKSSPRDPEALLALAEALEAMGHRAEAHERRGMAYVAQGKLPQAHAEFQALQRLQPDSRQAALLISQTLIQMDRNAEAARVVQAALPRHPQDAELKQRLAQLLVLSHTRHRARQVCEAWRQAEPEAARPLWLLGRIAQGSLQLVQAIDLFEQAARKDPNDPEILFSLGEALGRAGPRQSIPRALELLARAVERAPGEARYRYQLGLVLQQSGRLEPARRQFLRALDLDPGFTSAYTGLLHVSGRLQEPGQTALFAPIVRDLQQARRDEPALRARVYQAPDDPAGYAALARYRAARGDLKGARSQWEVAVALRPLDPAARRELDRLNRLLDVLR
jgi:cellulose synthase operon protein C